MTGKEDFITYEEASILAKLVKGLEEELLKRRYETIKYKRAFEIFKRLNGEHLPTFKGIGIISQEEYELLEELMGNENS